MWLFLAWCLFSLGVGVVFGKAIHDDKPRK